MRQTFSLLFDNTRLAPLLYPDIVTIFRQLQRLCQQNGTCMVYNHLFFYTDRLSGVVVRTAQVIAINALRQIITDNPPIGEQTGFIK